MTNATRSTWSVNNNASGIPFGRLMGMYMQRVFLAIPLISIMAFLPAVIMSPLYQVKLVSFFCVSSLVATAYMLAFIPNEKGGGESRPREIFTLSAADSKPILKYLRYLNGTLSLLLAINATHWRGRRGVHEGFWMLCLLPAGKYQPRVPTTCTYGT